MQEDSQVCGCVYSLKDGIVEIVWLLDFVPLLGDGNYYWSICVAHV